MKIITRIQLWFRRLKREHALRKQKEPLREFVYLDEVSVYSLIASKFGPVAAEFTETQTISLQGDAGSSIETNTGVVNANLNSSASIGKTKGTQILRKATVQTTFKDLYDAEAKSLVIKSIPQEKKYPKIQKLDTTIAQTIAFANEGWIINPDNLKRGKLLELEIQLEADAFFRSKTALSSILEIIEEDADIFSLDSFRDLPQMKSIGRILEKLLVGLVPIRGQAIDYSVVVLDGKEWLIHNNLLKTSLQNASLQTYPLYVVGVTCFRKYTQVK